MSEKLKKKTKAKSKCTNVQIIKDLAERCNFPAGWGR